jgi:glutamate-1-semialdehyde 2,1-aminomutase
VSAPEQQAGLPVIAESDRWFARADGLIPAWTQTLAKGPQQHVRGVAPKYLKRGKGARVWDVDGNAYVDLQMGIGPLVLGYADPRVDAAIRAQLEDGITFSLMHPLEVEVAELVRSVVPGAECVRYSKTGCDATTAAVRLARAFTGRSKVLCCGYHGWHDWYIAVTDRTAGIPAQVQELTHTFGYNDLQGLLDSIDDDTACVILEPMVFEQPKEGFLRAVRAACDAHGALLIFDEMWTGFRLALGGGQERFDVRADLACFSKAVANGMPLSLVTGRREVMRLCEKDVFFFTTFGGEALSLAAAKATIAILRDEKVPAQLERQGEKLRAGFQTLVQESGLAEVAKIAGAGCRTIQTFAPPAGDGRCNALELKSLAQQELLRRGVLWGGFHNLSQAHGDEELRLVLEAWRGTLSVMAAALKEGRVREALLGAPVEPVFRKTSQFNLRPVQKGGPK